jgi:putative ABC transport system permease protein
LLRGIADEHGAILQSYQDFSTTIDSMLAGVTASLWALLALGFLVALFGNVNTLTMNVLEQTQEIGLLRVVGMTRGQIRQFVMCQALVYALLALVPGLLCGCLVGYLVRSTSQGMFGQVAHFSPNSLMFALVFVVVFLLIVAVAWFPARRAVRVSMLAAIVRE